MGPYREAHGSEVIEAPTRQGTARLQIGPASSILEVGKHHRIVITSSDIAIEQLDRRKPKRRSYSLKDAHLIVARAVPTEDVGLWHESQPGMMHRLFGMQPVELLDKEAMAAWRQLEKLAERLAIALQQHHGDVVQASEFGRGQDRVLMTDNGDCFTVYVRKLFRERPRRALEVHTTGKLRFVTRHGEREEVCMSRFGVTVLGDRVRFADPHGVDVGSIWLPWIAPEDRTELAKLFGEQVDQGGHAHQSA